MNACQTVRIKKHRHAVGDVATLIVFSGLPGTGKTTIARALAYKRIATYLRIDTIEMAIHRADIGKVGPTGYTVAQAVAVDNLALGRTVIADCVNPVRACREAWRQVATRTGAAIIEVEIVCADEGEHRRRIETRTIDIEGVVGPTWDSIRNHDYEVRTDAHLVIDTACLSVAQAVGEIERLIG